MRRLLVLCLLAACGKTAAPPPEHAGPQKPRESDAAMTTRLLAELAKAGGCQPETLKVECIAARWSDPGGEPARLPDKELLVGMSIVLIDGEPVEESIDPTQGLMHLAALGLRKDETTRFARIASLAPNSKDSEELVAPVLPQVVDVLAGKARQIELPKDLADYLGDLPGAAHAPLARVEGGGWSWTVKMHAEMRYVAHAHAWVVVEIPEDGERGLIVTVLSENVH